MISIGRSCSKIHYNIFPFYAVMYQQIDDHHFIKKINNLSNNIIAQYFILYFHIFSDITCVSHHYLCDSTALAIDQLQGACQHYLCQSKLLL